MASVDDILKSMLEEMKKYQKEYDEATKQVNEIISTYTAKIDELQKQRLFLQDEGNKKIDILNARREQLSGKHSSLYEQYKKFAGKEPELTKNEDVTYDTVETKEDNSNKQVVEKQIKKSAKKVEPKKEEKATPIKEKVEKADGLSPDEIAKLTEITSEAKSDEKPSVDKNGNEIPEYLQDAYKK